MNSSILYNNKFLTKNISIQIFSVSRANDATIHFRHDHGTSWAWIRNVTSLTSHEMNRTNHERTNSGLEL